MNYDFDAALEETRRRLANIIRWAVVAEVDGARARVRVTSGGIRSDWLPFAAPAAGDVRVWRLPSAGEQVLLIAPSGELNAGVVWPAIAQDKFPPPSSDPNSTVILFSDGTTVVQNRSDGSLRISASGAVEVAAATQVQISAPVVRIAGKVELSGDLNVSGSIKASGDILADGANSNHHKH